MAESATPRQLVQALLQGTAPPQPLYLPIVFSHGARVENVALRAFLTNPTKISNSLRQIRARLHADGVMCYFDPLLEAEALGGTVQWEAEDRPPTLPVAECRAGRRMPGGLRSPEDAAKHGRVGVAVEVIRRLKSVLRDDCLLMAAVSGPFTLAAMLTQIDGGDTLRTQDISVSALDLATAAISPIAKALLEAGAGVIFIREEVLPALSAERCIGLGLRGSRRRSILSASIRRFPFCCCLGAGSSAANREVIVQATLGLHRLSGARRDGTRIWPAGFGVALPLEAFEPGDSGSAKLDEGIRRITFGSPASRRDHGGRHPCDGGHGAPEKSVGQLAFALSEPNR